MSQSGRPPRRFLDLPRFSLMLLALGFAYLTLGRAPTRVRHAGDLRQAIAQLIEAERGIQATPQDIRILSRSKWLRTEIEAVVPGKRHGERTDLYLVRATLSPEGQLLRSLGVWPLISTSLADESEIKVSGRRVLYRATSADGSHIGFIDLNGSRPPGNWSLADRLKQGLSNLQDYGSWNGIFRSTFRPERAKPPLEGEAPPAYAFERDGLFVFGEQGLIRFERSSTSQLLKMGPSSKDSPPGSAGRLRVQVIDAPVTEPPPWLNWLGDRLRESSLIGEARFQLLKAWGFDALGGLKRVYNLPTDPALQVAEDLGETQITEAAPSEMHPTGFPPAPIAPWVTPPIEGEGVFRSLMGDPFVACDEDEPCPFASTFVRADPKPNSQVYITLWDPRQLALSVVAGTTEPRSATGVSGSGTIPEEVLKGGRLVAAFNGGFLSRHGQFGMQSEGQLLVPPKPYAATVATLEGGRVGLGTWPEQAVPIPSSFIGFRQNLTPILQDGKVNPYKRHWWGGTPEGFADDKRTVRSGLCSTREGFLGYFYGNDLDPDGLARVMVRARCDYGMHLDMNPGHVGFEFYRVGQLESLGNRPAALASDWQAAGVLASPKGVEFRARLMLRHMPLMQFPRYIRPQARDFFYLTRNPVLLGSALKPITAPQSSASRPGEGRWQTVADGAWPPALAFTELRLPTRSKAVQLKIAQLDPKLIRLARVPGKEPVVASFSRPTDPFVGSSSVWLTDSQASISSSPPEDAGATWLTAGFRSRDPRVQLVAAGLGVTRHGMLLYADSSSTRVPAGDLSDFMKLAGCDDFVLLEQGLRLTHDVEAKRASGSTFLVRQKIGPIERLFPGTRVVSPAVWAPLQARRDVAGSPTSDSR